MNYKISFQQRAERAKEILSRQPKVTLEEAKQALEKLRKQTTQENRKRSS